MYDKIGVINEIGDMGLGFDELSESDAKVLKEQEKKEQEKHTPRRGKKCHRQLLQRASYPY